MKNIELAVKLAKAETEEEVIEIVKAFGVWDDLDCWKPFGGCENNWGTIGNQQSTAEAALVEKIINSIDANLMGECLSRHIDPEGPEAPKTSREAVERFYGVKHGNVDEMGEREKTKLAENIILAGTGPDKNTLNITIADRGEGQTPNRMPDTLLSIGKSNKMKIPFVQGKFNMGGTGTLSFCGEHGLQLIISRRRQDICNKEQDSSFGLWSVTLVRHEAPRENRKSSMFTYLTDKNGNMLTFSADSLEIIPKEHNNRKDCGGYDSMNWGTYIKLYNYGLKTKTCITLTTMYKLSVLVPQLALPVRLREARRCFEKANTLASTLTGIIPRLQSARIEQNLEDGFPLSGRIAADGQQIPYSIYLFKTGRQTHYKTNDGVILSVNGQSQCVLSEYIFERLKMTYIAKSLLVLLDCTDVDVYHREHLFMPSRDRLREGSDFACEVKSALEDMLKNNEGLQQALKARRAESLRNKIADDKPLKDTLMKIMKASPVLSRVLLQGGNLSAPYCENHIYDINKDFKGKLHPTFFSLKGKLKDGRLEKKVPLNQGFRVQFSTDVDNDYFNRTEEQGRLLVTMDGQTVTDTVYNLYNGTATLSLHLPEEAAEGDSHTYSVQVVDDYIAKNFENEFSIVVTKAIEPSEGGNGDRQPAVNRGKKGDQPGPAGFAVPEVRDVHQDEWVNYGMNRDSALIYIENGDSGDFYLNADNICLLTELKGMKRNNREELTRARFRLSMALIGMSIVAADRNLPEDQKSKNLSEDVKRFTSMIAPILLPMIQSMSDLEFSDLVQAA